MERVLPARGVCLSVISRSKHDVLNEVCLDVRVLEERPLQRPLRVGTVPNTISVGRDSNKTPKNTDSVTIVGSIGVSLTVIDAGTIEGSTADEWLSTWTRRNSLIHARDDRVDT